MTHEYIETQDIQPQNMKPERSEDIEKLVRDAWTVHPPYIRQTFEYTCFKQASEFADVILAAAEQWGVRLDYSIEQGTATFEIAPAKGNVLTEKTFEFARGMNAVYNFVHSGPAPEDD